MPSSCFFLLLVWVWVWSLPLMLVPAQEQRQGAAGCSASTRCGELTISDPFWIVEGETGSSRCGSPDFEVNCYDNAPFIRGYGFLGFRIIHINYGERSLVAADLARLIVLNTSNSCDAYPTWNASVKLGPQFRIDPVNLNMILYNCTELTAALLTRDTELVETTMRCENQSRVFARMAGSYNETSYYAGYAVDGCDACVVPALRSPPGVVANASHYAQLIHGGFLVTWETPFSPPPPPPPRLESVGKFIRPSFKSSFSHIPRKD